MCFSITHALGPLTSCVKGISLHAREVLYFATDGGVTLPQSNVANVQIFWALADKEKYKAEYFHALKLYLTFSMFLGV